MYKNLKIPAVECLENACKNQETNRIKSKKINRTLKLCRPTLATSNWIDQFDNNEYTLLLLNEGAKYSKTCPIKTVKGLRKTVLNREVSLLGRLTSDYEI